jgi:hypothetical protein
MFALITPRGNSTWRRSKRAHPATAVPQSASCSRLVAHGSLKLSSNYGVALLGTRQCRDAAIRVSTRNYFQIRFRCNSSAVNS